MFFQAWKDFAKAKFEKPPPVHFRCIFTQTEEEEDQEAATEPNPTIEFYDAAGRNHEDAPPFWTVYQAPRVWEVRNGAVAVEDI